ncbi:DUF3102 domain-containing protein [Desulfosporosinus sp. OT]|uniref:DUF3102 domain-containing protein n=1 Tax=Desulfosporosinus sp. OT TaxID=913865 RepID=UPI0002239CC2|nr:DUF3102 domain-containing protein [Desulfosporosinus sp. OT]EGW40117.1 hypothetical protein DOT_1989 [Desulfosporosinus sp. OT]
MIAAEITTIKHQTGKILLTCAIEIGRRLKEARNLIPNGNWGKWLEESVSYSQSTAERLIRIFDAYGAQTSPSLDGGTQVQGQMLPNLNYSQALILLGVPEEERAQFIAELDVESMSVRELKKAVNERSQAVKERDQALQEKAELQKTLDEQAGKMTQLSTERDSLKRKADESGKSQTESEAKAGKLQKELLAIKQSIDFKQVERLNKNLNAAYLKARGNKIVFLYESLDRIFKDLMWEMKELAVKDPEAHEVYRNPVIDFLTPSLKEKNLSRI